MLRGFDSWSDVIQYVKSGAALYYVPDDSIGPCPTIARVRPTVEGDPVRLWLRCPDKFMASPYPSTIADEMFIDKLYRWEPRKAATR